ncbi:MAG TPA: putative toxin-antitoxin system toxin component, PIN family [Verrucomicrobiae bacterium]
MLDANVVASGVCWQGEAYRCLVKIARRQAFAYATEGTLAEARDTAARLIRELEPKNNAASILSWYLEKVKIIEPAPLGKQRSRDATDDPYLAAALAACAGFIVSYDKDLLELKKPFGIEIIRPAQFLKLVKG